MKRLPLICWNCEGTGEAQPPSMWTGPYFRLLPCSTCNGTGLAR